MEQDEVLESETIAYKPDLVRLGGKSQEDTNTRQGQSALVTGVGYNRMRHFSSYGTSTVHADVPDSFKTSDVPESEFKGKSFTKIDGGFHSRQAYSIQAEKCTRTLESEYSDDETTLLVPMPRKLKTIRKGKRTFQHIKCCKTVSLLFVFGVMFLAALNIALIYVSLTPGTLSDHIYIDNQDMVLLNFFDTFYYKVLAIHKALNNQCTDCKVEVYSFYPDNLIVGDNYFNISSGVLTATRADVLLAPKYYVSGSKIKMSVEFFPTKGQNSSVQFVIFNNLQQYEAYRRGDKTNPHQVYSVQVNEGKKFFSLSLMLTETGYYFIGIKPLDTSVTFQSTITAHQIYYSRADFPPPTCVLDSADSCTIQFTPSATDEYTDTLKMCVLVYSVPPQEVARSYFVSLDYEVYRRFWTSRSEGLLSVICLFLVLLFFLSLYCCVCCLHNVVRQARTK